MSEAYATLLVRKEEDLLLMMAEIIRENSAIYPGLCSRYLMDPPFDSPKKRF